MDESPLTFSANLGMLWADLPLPDAIHAAKGAGFVAVECHWPYDTPPALVRQALQDTGLPMLGLNTRRGRLATGEFGLSALAGREVEARAAIDEALGYAAAIGAGSVHVMAGVASGTKARQVFEGNLAYACAKAAPLGITVLIEALNPHDAPGYFVGNSDQALSVLKAVAAPNLKLMFDCYHVGRTEGDMIQRLHALCDHIGHIQFAAVPDRGAPDHGTVDYRAVFQAIRAMGYTRPLGAEYRPGRPTDQTLDWMKTLAPQRPD